MPDSFAPGHPAIVDNPPERYCGGDVIELADDLDPDEVGYPWAAWHPGSVGGHGSHRTARLIPKGYGSAMTIGHGLRIYRQTGQPTDHPSCSGGPFQAVTPAELTYGGRTTGTFWDWSDGRPCAHNGVDYAAEVNRWIYRPAPKG